MENFPEVSIIPNFYTCAMTKKDFLEEGKSISKTVIY
jgi:hypothetical protein